MHNAFDMLMMYLVSMTSKFSANSQANKLLEIKPSCSGENLKNQPLIIIHQKNSENSYRSCVPRIQPATKMYVIMAITKNKEFLGLKIKIECNLYLRGIYKSFALTSKRGFGGSLSLFPTIAQF